MSPQERRDAGRAATAAGRFEDALRECVWFHDEALKHDPAFYGVRLSYALNDWVDLGKQYPEALRVLVSIRDAKTERLAKGEGSLEIFHDVAAINDHIDESSRTYTLFRDLAGEHPEFAKLCSRIALPYVVAEGDFELAARFLPELEVAMESLARDLNARVRELQQRPGPSSASESTMSAIMFGTEAGLYAEDVRLFVVVLRWTGRLQEAAELRTRALALVADPSIREKVRLLVPDDG